MCFSVHQFIHSNPIKSTDTKIIIGTIHPHINCQTHNPCSSKISTNQNGPSFKFDFFYGSNRNSFWSIIQRVKRISFTNTNDIQSFLSTNKIAISDMICECNRPTCQTTQDKLLIPISYNQHLLCQIVNSNINTLLFTSSFATNNNAAALFYKHFNIQKPKVAVPGDIFQQILTYNGVTKTVQIVLLPSPSRIAIKGLARNKNFLSSGFHAVSDWIDVFYCTHI